MNKEDFQNIIETIESVYHEMAIEVARVGREVEDSHGLIVMDTNDALIRLYGMRDFRDRLIQVFDEVRIGYYE